MNSPNMILRNSLVRTAIRRATAAPESASRQLSSVTTSKAASGSLIGTWYKIFGSSTAGYATWLAFGIVLGEMFTGWGTDTMWRSVNYGKTFDTVDWSKFDPEDEEDEEEDDDDDDDE